MSQAVIDFVVEGYRRYNERDRSRPWPDDDNAAHWHDTYPDLWVTVTDVRVNGDKVLAWVHRSGHGAGSGVPIEMQLAHVRP